MTDKEQNHIKVDLDFLDNNSNGQKSDVVSNHKNHKQVNIIGKHFDC